MTETMTATGLVHYTAACRELAEATRIDEVKSIYDKAAALKAYAKQAKDKTLFVNATKIQKRALRKLSDQMKAKRAAGLMNKGGRPRKTGGNFPPVYSEEKTLRELGIDKELAKAVRRVGGLSEAQYEAEIELRGRLAAAVVEDDRKVIREAKARLQAEKAELRARKERDLAGKIKALPDQRYGIVYADPPWHFKIGADSGLDRHPSNHYPTMTLAEIMALDVPSLAAPDSVLWLWATAAMLPQALEVMKAWGFSYKSQYIWVKDKFGTGYWNRCKHELLLIGTRGNIPAPSPDLLQPSIIPAPVGRHSEKPTDFAELIELYYPTVPKIELYRRGPARKGWAAWGAEAEDGGAAPSVGAAS